MFEVLGTLQKSMLDIIKSQTMYLVAAEESVKKLSRDVEVFTDRKNKKLNQSNQASGQVSNINRGTKSLMEEIQNEIKETGYENIDGLEEINPEDVE
jgi:Na+-transporting NADH:ubiquinone oxidoreductase subunit NqrA